jgi:hypothetical protein
MNDDNQGAIWGNNNRKSANSPDFTGSMVVGGVDYWISAWKRKEDANPKAPALNFRLTPKEEIKPPTKYHTPDINDSS